MLPPHRKRHGLAAHSNALVRGSNTRESMSVGVQQAILLLAGRGSRLADLTEHCPKCLIKINGRTILERMLDALVRVRVREVILVVGYRHKEVISFIGHTYGPLRVRYVINEQWRTSNNIVSVLLAQRYIKSHFLLLEGDVVLGTEALPLLRHINTMAVSPYEPYMDGTVVRVDVGGRVDAMFLKSDPGRPTDLSACYKTVNLYCFKEADYRRAVAPRIESLVAAGHEQVFYEYAIADAIHTGDLQLRAVDFRRCVWAEIDDPQDLARAEMMFQAYEQNKLKD